MVTVALLGVGALASALLAQGGVAAQRGEHRASVADDGQFRHRLDFGSVAEANVATAKCGFCNAIGDPVAVTPADPAVARMAVLLLCRECGSVLAALPYSRPQTLRP